MKNKRGINYIGTVVIFLILNVVFFVVMFAAVSNLGSPDSLYEDAYAKKIALFLDAAKPGTIISMDLSELYLRAKENDFNPEIKIDCEKNEVFIKLSPSTGNSYKFVTDYPECSYTLDNQNWRILIRT